MVDSDRLARRGLLLRHLVMPGLLAETEAVLRFVAGELGPDTYVDLMAQAWLARVAGKAMARSTGICIGRSTGRRSTSATT